MPKSSLIFTKITALAGMLLAIAARCVRRGNSLILSLTPFGKGFGQKFESSVNKFRVKVLIQECHDSKYPKLIDV